MSSLSRFILLRDSSTADTNTVVVAEGIKLNLSHHNLMDLPVAVLEKNSENVEILDLSYNKISEVQFLSQFGNLTTVVLDHNFISSKTVFPRLPTLHTLWVNNNDIVDLAPFIPNLVRSCPGLQILSMMKNRAAPSYLNGGSLNQYMIYRYYVISQFPNLKYLDDNQITQKERTEAHRFFGQPGILGIVRSLWWELLCNLPTPRASKNKII